MDTSVTKIGNGINGFHKHSNESKNRLRIQGTAILERENHPNISATYDYTTSYANEFFEEDVNQLHCFELNKIALGMTIFKKEQVANGIKNSSLIHEDSNGSALVLHKFNTETAEPFLTDVIWSRMDIANPYANPNAYIIKQYYPKMKRNHTSHADKCNNFLCGFLTCCIMIFLGCLVAFFPDVY